MSREQKVIKEFIDILDVLELSDEGREFHPVQISCCRVGMQDKLVKCLKEMRAITYDK